MERIWHNTEGLVREATRRLRITLQELERSADQMGEAVTGP